MAAPLKVLCIDGDRDNARSIVWLLALCGCDAQVGFDGPSALRVAAAFRPDVCVLDVSLPGSEALVEMLRGEADRLVRLIALVPPGIPTPAGFERHLVSPADPQLVVEAVTGEELVVV